ncbi:MAG: hypothetical protein A3F12_00225 [Gammaproteobacteria bacterium RIFCSPHIGHO2_12_FULL_38_14]|nr:MAG: hypothetical protein A3F12_00225 [Gammaproteobacteria bacterium RIFCSPHIGHO2_12_FULL_38_14]
MNKETAIAIFGEKNIRRVWLDGKWYFSIQDVLEVLTESSDVKQYVKKLKARDPVLNANWGTICTLVEMKTMDEKRRKIQAATTEGLLRIIQSIPSPKAEPFKQWLAKVGYERIREIENPELAQERMKKMYELKGYPQDWIDICQKIKLLPSAVEKWLVLHVEQQRKNWVGAW